MVEFLYVFLRGRFRKSLPSFVLSLEILWKSAVLWKMALIKKAMLAYLKKEEFT